METDEPMSLKIYPVAKYRGEYITGLVEIQYCRYYAVSQPIGSGKVKSSLL